MCPTSVASSSWRIGRRPSCAPVTRDGGDVLPLSLYTQVRLSPSWTSRAPEADDLRAVHAGSRAGTGREQGGNRAGTGREQGGNRTGDPMPRICVTSDLHLGITSEAIIL